MGLMGLNRNNALATEKGLNKIRKRIGLPMANFIRYCLPGITAYDTLCI